MKTLFPLLFLLTVHSSLFSQKKIDMSYVPAMTIAYDNDTCSNMSLWVSSEVTNGLYKQFINYVRSYPDDSLCYIDFHYVESKVKGIPVIKRLSDTNQISPRRDTSSRYKTICIKNSVLIPNVIDSSAWLKDPVFMKKHPNYFQNKKYDHLPVKGVSYTTSLFFFSWFNHNYFFSKDKKIISLISLDKSQSKAEEAFYKEYSYCRLPEYCEWKAINFYLMNDSDYKATNPIISSPKGEIGFRIVLNAYR